MSLEKNPRYQKDKSDKINLELIKQARAFDINNFLIENITGQIKSLSKNPDQAHLMSLLDQIKVSLENENRHANELRPMTQIALETTIIHDDSDSQGGKDSIITETRTIKKPSHGTQEVNFETIQSFLVEAQHTTKMLREILNDYYPDEELLLRSLENGYQNVKN